MLKWFKREKAARAVAAERRGEPGGKAPVAGRRAFFKAGAGAVVGGAALTAGGKAAQAAEPGPDAAGYRETDHVRRYYDSARM